MTAALVALAALFAIFLIGCGRDDPQTGNANSVQVTKVVDGDTIKVRIGGRQESVRLIGMDTPETHSPYEPVECYGAEATVRTAALLKAAGNRVELEKDVSETDKYGRLLRYVWLDGPNGRVMLNEELVEEGYARAVRYPPDVKFAAQFEAEQAQAKQVHAGLWGACGSFGVPAK